MKQERNIREIVEAYKKSGMGRKQFAASQGLEFSKLRYWIGKVNKEKAKEKAKRSSFIQLNAIVASPAPALVEIGYPSGVKIKVTTTDFPFLSQLIRL